MTRSKRSRRDFLKTGGGAFGISFIALNMPLILAASDEARKNIEEGAAFANVTRRQAAQFKSIVDQIIPAGDTPSASETGVVQFIDVALGGFMADALPLLSEGLDDLEKRSKTIHPTASDFSDLSFEQQTQLLQEIEDTEFFGPMHLLTLCGMFCMPKYGGNRDHSGWKLLGFNHQHAWQPPFGHYDSPVHGEVKNNEQG